VEWEDERAIWLSGISNNSHEKDIAVADLNNDGWIDIVVAQKPFFQMLSLVLISF